MNEEIMISPLSGNIGPFRYVMLIRDNPPQPRKLSHRRSTWRINRMTKRQHRRRGSPLVGWVDYGRNINQLTTEDFKE